MQWLMKRITIALHMFDAPYHDDSAMMICQERIVYHGHAVEWWALGYICEDFDRDGFCS